ncbi:MAG: thiamine diphosphokinase [Anaerolineae bacterium]|nr:thiamine diphosphokinase [Anaerolineae bacterium]
MHCLILANGPAPVVEQIQYYANQADLVIAADGGAAHALAAGLFPDVVVGDLDSLTPELLAELRAAEVTVLRFPTRKNETDMELTLAEAVRRGAARVTILAATGGRLDQTIGNILLLTLPAFQAVPMRLITDTEEAFVARGYAHLAGEAGDTVSLIPLTPKVTGVTTLGLEYPLERADLQLGPSLGISNAMMGADAEVKVHDGLLLVVHAWQHPPYRAVPSANGAPPTLVDLPADET